MRTTSRAFGSYFMVYGPRVFKTYSISCTSTQIYLRLCVGEFLSVLALRFDHLWCVGVCEILL